MNKVLAAPPFPIAHASPTAPIKLRHSAGTPLCTRRVPKHEERRTRPNVSNPTLVLKHRSICRPGRSAKACGGNSKPIHSPRGSGSTSQHDANWCCPPRRCDRGDDNFKTQRWQTVAKTCSKKRPRDVASSSHYFGDRRPTKVSNTLANFAPALLMLPPLYVNPSFLRFVAVLFHHAHRELARRGLADRGPPRTLTSTHRQCRRTPRRLQVHKFRNSNETGQGTATRDEAD